MAQHIYPMIRFMNMDDEKLVNIFKSMGYNTPFSTGSSMTMEQTSSNLFSDFEFRKNDVFHRGMEFWIRVRNKGLQEYEADCHWQPSETAVLQSNVKTKSASGIGHSSNNDNSSAQELSNNSLDQDNGNDLFDRVANRNYNKGNKQLIREIGRFERELKGRLQLLSDLKLVNIDKDKMELLF